jgi:transposase
VAEIRTEVFRSGSGAAAKQPELFGPSLEERLADCPLVLALVPLVERVVGDRLRGLYRDGGGVPYDPVAIFSVWMFGYLEGERSSRRLERACKYDIRYEYLSRSCYPDYSTLCRFRKRLESILDSLFLEIVQACKETGLVTCKSVAVDGTKIMAKRTQWRKALQESEAVDAFEEEARTMFTTHGEFLVGYNIQAVADTQHGIVVGFVATNHANDSHLLAPALQATERLSGMLPETAVMDKGYDSGLNASAAVQLGVEVVIPSSISSLRPFAQDEKGTMRCMAGHAATRHDWIDQKTEQIYDHFRVSKCRKCLFRQECGTSGHQRAMKVMVGTLAQDKAAANARAKTPEGKAFLLKRGPTIERRFSVLKREQGLRRFLLAGLAGAQLECGLAFMGQNLKALLRAFLSFIRLLIWILSRTFAPTPTT